MKTIAFFLLYPAVAAVSRLPFRILYLLSDLSSFVIFRVLGYRRGVVRSNIRLALPHLSEQEAARIEKRFYRHFTDIFFEMIKTMSISRKELDRRFVFTNPEVYQSLESQGKSIVLVCAHYANYEWLLCKSDIFRAKRIGIYKKIRNGKIDGLVRGIRSRFDAALVDTRQAVDRIAENERRGIQAVYGFLADQSPKLSRGAYWSEFFGAKVPVHTGPEVIARRMGMNAIFVRVSKVGRGYYEATFEEIAQDVRSLQKYEMTGIYLGKVEREVCEAPEYYLWTHKRWKHRAG